MYQTWERLLFLHWAVDPADVQHTLPPGLTVDTFDGKAWLGVVPFFMKSVRPRFCPPVPWLSFFLEANLRTYVHDAHGNAGVWFYSLDCNQRLAVWTARTFFHLPYENATMAARVEGDRVDYRFTRRGHEAGSRFVYEPTGTAAAAPPESLEFYLAERYLLFAETPRGVVTGRVHHTPYPLQSVDVLQWDDRLITMAGFDSPARSPDHAVYAAGVNVHIHPLQRPL